MADKVFTMRIEETLLDKIRESAERNKRSIAKEIEYILDLHYAEAPEMEKTYNSAEVDQLFTRLVELINKHGAISGRLIPPTDK